MRFRLNTMAVLCAVAALGVSAHGQDLTIKLKVTEHGHAGTATDYLSADRMRSSNGDHDTIIDFAAGTITNVDHKRKEYSTISVAEIESMMKDMNAKMSQASSQMQEAMKNMPAGMRDRMKGMMGGDTADVTVTKGGTKEIAGYATQQYTIAMGPSMRIEEWNTTQLQLPMKPGAFAHMARFTNPMLSNPMLKGAGQLAEKMKEIQGYPLAQSTTVSMMGHEMESSREATEITKGALPASTFEVPSGYKKVPSPLEKMNSGKR